MVYQVKIFFLLMQCGITVKFVHKIRKFSKFQVI